MVFKEILMVLGMYPCIFLAFTVRIVTKAMSTFCSLVYILGRSLASWYLAEATPGERSFFYKNSIMCKRYKIIGVISIPILVISIALSFFFQDGVIDKVAQLIAAVVSGLLANYIFSFREKCLENNEKDSTVVKMMTVFYDMCILSDMLSDGNTPRHELISKIDVLSNKLLLYNMVVASTKPSILHMFEMASKNLGIVTVAVRDGIEIKDINHLKSLDNAFLSIHQHAYFDELFSKSNRLGVLKKDIDSIVYDDWAELKTRYIEAREEREIELMMEPTS